jgi:hypothetical protein
MKNINREIRVDSLRYSYVLFVMIFALILTLNSCCAKVDCVGADEIDGINLKNFASTDIDSVIITAFKKNTGFKILTDSFLVESGDSFWDGEYYLLFNYKMVSMDNDYRIYFTKINKTYEVSEFETSKAECGECIIKNSYRRLDSYKINSRSKTLGYIEIDKDID